MTTIDKLDISVYNLYAIRTKMIEQINQQYALEKAGAIPAHTAMLDLYPKLTEIDILLGIVPMFTPWAYFYPPKKFGLQRRSPFAFHRIVPSIGSLTDQREDEETIAKTQCESPGEEEEKAAIWGCLKQIEKINGWLGFIVGRVGQFLQG